MVCKTLNEFENRWEAVCSKIEKQELDRNKANCIMDDFLNEIQVFTYTQKDITQSEILQIMVEIANNLKLSLDIAINNYERVNQKSLWQKIFGDKPIEVDINAIKTKIGIL